MEKRTVRKGILAVGAILLMSNAALGQSKFDHVHYLKPGTKGENEGNHRVKGSVVFDGDQKVVKFLDEKSDSTLSIPTDKITNMFVEKKLRLIPAYDLLLTIRYADPGGTEQSVVITLGLRNWRHILMAAAAETRKEVFHVDGCCPL
jgi:hypothetical protein